MEVVQVGQIAKLGRAIWDTPRINISISHGDNKQYQVTGTKIIEAGLSDMNVIFCQEKCCRIWLNTRGFIPIMCFSLKCKDLFTV